MTDIYMSTHDIDWFCCINHVYIHVASAGCKLPEIYRTMNYQILKSFLNRALSLPIISDYVLNENYINQYLINNGEEDFEHEFYDDSEDDIFLHDEPKIMRLYSRSFVEMARRGFYSFDKSEGENDNYHLVAKPTIALQESQMQLVFPKQLLTVDSDSLSFDSIDQLTGVKLVDIIDNNTNRDL